MNISNILWEKLSFQNGKMFTPISETTLLSVTEQYLQKPKGIRRLFLKPFETTLDWIEFFNSHIPESLKNARSLLTQSNKFLSIPEYPKKVEKFFIVLRQCRRALKEKDYWKGREKSAKALSISSKLVTPISETLTIANEDGLISLSQNQLKILSFLSFYGSAALSCFSFFGLGRAIQELTSNRIESSKFHFAILQLIHKVASLVLGIFGIIHTFVESSIAAPWVLLSLSTTLLVSAILKYYYRKLMKQSLKTRTYGLAPYDNTHLFAIPGKIDRR